MEHHTWTYHASTRLASLRLTSTHSASPQLTSPHLTDSLSTSPHRAAPHRTSLNLTTLSAPLCTSLHLAAPHRTSLHLTTLSSHLAVHAVNALLELKCRNAPVARRSVRIAKELETHVFSARREAFILSCRTAWLINSTLRRPPCATSSQLFIAIFSCLLNRDRKTTRGASSCSTHEISVLRARRSPTSRMLLTTAATCCIWARCSDVTRLQVNSAWRFST